MRSLRRWKAGLVLGLLVGNVTCGAVLPAQPIITPKPEIGEALLERQIPDPISFAQLLLTAIPQSLRQIAATNAPAVSSILWEEFLDEKRPQWFLDLPWEIQSYLIRTFGPSTAYLPPSPTRSGAQVTPPESVWSWPTGTDSLQASRSIYSSPFAQPSSSLRPSRSGFQTSSTQPTSSSKTTQVSSSKIATSAISASLSSNVDTTRSIALGSASDDPASPPVSNAGLSRDQKIGLGVGIPLGIIGAAAVLLGCCFLLRRRRNRRVNGTEPPSSPGFIPRFAFQDKSTDNIEHRRPLNPPNNQTGRDLGTFDWEEDGIDPFETDNPDTSYRGHTIPPAGAPPSGVPASPPMAMHDAAPIMAPALYHTHSSNRARGKRTSYSSLHSVAELSEPDETAESPVLGRNITPLERKRRPSMPMVLEIPASIASNNSSIKRKPVPTSPQASNPAADLASQSLLRPQMRQPDHSGSSSSGLALSTNSSTYANPDYSTTSPISPLSEHSLPFSSRSSQALPTKNPFSNDYSYVEDYGPEYSAGYVDDNDGLYGGHTSLSRYPDPSTSPTSARRSSKTDWPLRNLSLGRKREKSPLWDRVYESP